MDIFNLNCMWLHFKPEERIYSEELLGHLVNWTLNLYFHSLTSSLARTQVCIFGHIPSPAPLQPVSEASFILLFHII